MDVDTLYIFAVATTVTLLFILFFLFIFFKVKQIRTAQYLGGRKQYYSAIARMWFGAFMALFGINTMLQFQTAVAYVIGGVFIIFGILNILSFNRRRKHFKNVLPDEDREYAEWQESKDKNKDFKHSTTKVVKKR